MALRPAIITAVSLNVCCPYCGEPQPAPDNGSDAWMPSQVDPEAAKGSRTCVSCDKTFRIDIQTRVSVAY